MSYLDFPEVFPTATAHIKHQQKKIEELEKTIETQKSVIAHQHKTILEAEEVIAFYASATTWQKYTSLYGDKVMPARFEKDRESDYHVPGKRAREYQKKYLGDK